MSSTVTSPSGVAGGSEPVFPLTDQLPLGRAAAGAPVSAMAAPGEPSLVPGRRAGRPFGLRFATVPAESSEAALDLDAVRYDETAQIALVPDGAGWTPLARHAMALTLHTTGQIPREDEIFDKS